MKLRDLVTVGFAAHRAARAVATDSITKPLRDRLEVWSIDIEASDAQVARREKLVQLVRCQYCCGFWLALVTFAALVAARRKGWWLLERCIDGWAGAGVQSTITSFRQMIDDHTD
ncbi:DUF1360 domain-containing protein [Desertimonas flava]|uniref:DUF1360 domain-containing protein n=1 Tax=Desertimonas flava TaxID=2064846 RepID=UPI0013C4CFF7|nr:DUF1360 domain-containing protein [Desertimonas flava]